MLHPIYHEPGRIVSLPELSSAVSNVGTEFRVVDVLEGGMGMCLHLVTSDGNRHLALKSPRPELIGDSDTYERFVDELKVWLAASECSLIAEALAVIKINNLPCVCAEWMHGGDYSAKICQLPPRLQIINLLRVVRGLRWVYEHLGVIHRDLKPQNLLLDVKNHVFIADWGLSRPVAEQLKKLISGSGQGTPQQIDRTQAGSFVGTVCYAAPEQIRGKSDIDFRADIYALGCIMFEMETGSPPFTGNSWEVIAYHHLNTPPRKLGGLFSKTKLGLERIISCCLEKEPASRFESYSAIEQELIRLARKVGADVEQAKIEERYQRNVIGQGDYAETFQRNAVKGKDGWGVMGLKEVKPHFDEACSLMSLSRYADAKAILEQLYQTKNLEKLTDWFYVHTIGLNLATCITQLDNPPIKAVEILQSMSRLAGKPAEYYVNYSLALLKSSRAEDAGHICARGLRHFSDDAGIIGNNTIALLRQRKLEAALESAQRRLQIRRDINSLEEGAAVLRNLAEGMWLTDLPNAFGHASTAIKLLDEGLVINPDASTLKLNKVDVLQLVGLRAMAEEICNDLIDGEFVHPICRHNAFCRKVEIMAGRFPKEAHALIIEHGPKITTPQSKEHLRLLENKILAESFMIGQETDAGERILRHEPIEFFLDECRHEGKYKYPIQAAKILEWMDRGEEALEELRQTPDSWEAVHCMAQILSRAGKHDMAKECSNRLLSLGRMKAESYDLASYVYKMAGEMAQADDFKQKGDSVFSEEERLRSALEASVLAQ